MSALVRFYVKAACGNMALTQCQWLAQDSRQPDSEE